MPKYFCDYCDTYLTHDSPSVRKTHCQGRKHKDNVKFYYQKWMEEQAQHLIDATTAAYKAGKIPANPFANVNSKSGVLPPMGVSGRPMMPPPGLVGPPTMPPPSLVPPMGAAIPPPLAAPHLVVNPMVGLQQPMLPVHPGLVPPPAAPSTNPMHT